MLNDRIAVSCLTVENPDTLIDMAYDALEGSEDLLKYHERHGTPSLLILTQHSPEIAHRTAALLKPYIENKVVVEIGAGVGFLAIEMARLAKQVYAIEVDPAWSWIFTRSLYAHKPANLTWIFGTAESMIGKIYGDIAIVVTRSGHERLEKLSSLFAPKVLMPLKSEVADGTK